MSCDEASRRFDGSLDGELSPSDREAFTRHLRARVDCRATFTLVSTGVGLVRDAAEDDAVGPLPEELVQRLLARLRQEATASSDDIRSAGGGTETGWPDRHPRRVGESADANGPKEEDRR